MIDSDDDDDEFVDALDTDEDDNSDEDDFSSERNKDDCWKKSRLTTRWSRLTSLLNTPAWMPPTCCLQEINCLACLERNGYRKTYRYDDFIKEVSLPICLGWSSEGVFLIPNSESIVLFPEAIDSRPNLFKPSYISTQQTWIQLRLLKSTNL